MIKRVKRWLRNRDVRRKYYKKGAIISGHNLYIVNDPLQMPVQRALALHNLLHEFDLKANHTDLVTGLNMIIKNIDEGKTSMASWAAHTLKSYLQLYTNNKTMFRLADVLVLIDDEPAEYFSEEHTIQKEGLYNNSDKARAFFLSTTWSNLLAIGNTLKDFNAEDYLQTKRVRMAEQSLQSLVGTTTLRDTERKPTK